jgi:hypothetical protein
VTEPHDGAFRRAILALAGGPCDDRIVRLAADLSKPKATELVGVHVVEVGWSMPLDADVATRSNEPRENRSSSTRSTPAVSMPPADATRAVPRSHASESVAVAPMPAPASAAPGAPAAALAGKPRSD